MTPPEEEAAEPSASADDTLELNLPLHESPDLEHRLAQLGLSVEEEDQVRLFAEDGYLTLDLSETAEQSDAFDRIAQRIIEDTAPRTDGEDVRTENSWSYSEAVRSLACDPLALQMVETLFGRRAFPFQTLNFRAGSEQSAHSDTLHFHCAPSGFMCGVWVALEDTDPENGPLVVYPGSHRLPVLDMSHLGLLASQEEYPEYERRVRSLLRTSGFSQKEVHLKRGQALIWAANLYHGGAPIRTPGRTRHSQVTHYYFDDCVYFIPKQSRPEVGRMCMREAIDLRTGRMAEHRTPSGPVEWRNHPRLWTYDRPLPDWVINDPLPEEAYADANDGVIGMIGEERKHIQDLEIELRAKQRFIEARNEEWVYKTARRVTKTWRRWTGRDDSVDFAPHRDR